MKIAAVILDADLAGEVRAAAETAGHELIGFASVAEAKGSGAGLVLAEWTKGPQLAQLLRDLPAGAGQNAAPVIVVAPAGGTTVMRRAREAGAADVLFRPLDAKEILAEIAEVCAGSAAFDPTLLEAFGELRGRSLVGESPKFLKCLEELKQAARCDANVLLLGPTGTGKEMLAQGIHRLSRRSNNPYMAVNCASLPPTLLEAELFGHVRGSFTDAKEDRPGRFEAVGAGTLLLDEVGDIEVSLQVKLLRVIEEREFARLGENRLRPFNARLVCATAVDLDAAVGVGRFRAELLGRINQFRITIPALRDRPGDVSILASHFLQKHARGRWLQISPSATRALEEYGFPMNVRQLENAIIEAVARCNTGTLILPRHLPNEIVASAESQPNDDARIIPVPQGLTYVQAREDVCRELDRLYLPALLRKHDNNQGLAAREAGIDRKTFAIRLAALDQAAEGPPNA